MKLGARSMEQECRTPCSLLTAPCFYLSIPSIKYASCRRVGDLDVVRHVLAVGEIAHRQAGTAATSATRWPRLVASSSFVSNRAVVPTSANFSAVADQALRAGRRC